MPFSMININKSNINLIKYIISLGVVFFAAGGNEGPMNGSINPPGNIFEIITISSFKYYHKISDFSSTGPIINKQIISIKPDFLALGENLFMGKKECEFRAGTTISSIIALYYASEIYKKLKKINIGIVYFILYNNSYLDKKFTYFQQGFGFIQQQITNFKLKDKIKIFPNILNFNKSNKLLNPVNYQPFFYSKYFFYFKTKIVSYLNNYIIVDKIDYQIFPVIYQNDILIYFKFEKGFKYINYLIIKFKLKKSINKKVKNDSIVINIFINFIANNKNITRKLILKVDAIKRPDNIILLDMSKNNIHSLSDNLTDIRNKYDTFGDSIYTNYKKLFQSILKNGYYIELNFSYISCVNLNLYKILMIIDIEYRYDYYEILNIIKGFKNGLNIIFVSEWFDSSRKKGNNLLNINLILSYFGIRIQLGNYSGYSLYNNNNKIDIINGSYIENMPSFSYFINGSLYNYSNNILKYYQEYPIFALIDYKEYVDINYGKLSILTDSTCIENNINSCLDLIIDSLYFFNKNLKLSNYNTNFINYNKLFVDYNNNHIYKNKNNKCINNNILNTKIYEIRVTNSIKYYIYIIILILIFTIFIIYKYYLTKYRYHNIKKNKYSVIYI